MPLYEYQCDACGHRFEVIQKFSDPPVDKCPKCGSPVRKLQASPAIQFKGSGWYITDYAKKSSRDEEKAGASKSDGEKSDAGSSKEASAKSESTAPKADTAPAKTTKTE
jgi:putative FmdB family regulatory protein